MIPTRGILCTTRRNVLIEKNVFDNLSMAGIYLSNDCNDWYESGPIHNMIIRKNIFNVKKSPVTKNKKGAVLIEPIIVDKDNSEVSVHRNILIEDNVFYMEHDNVLNAEHTDNIRFINNKVYSVNGEKIEAFIFKKCKDVSIENNFYSENVSNSADGTN